MNHEAKLALVEQLIDEVKLGILTTVDREGVPRSRWMTPVIISRLKGALYAVTSIESKKALHIEEHPSVTWIFQTPSLDKIGTLTGTASLVRDPALSAEVIEAIGPRLEQFWSYTGDPRKLIIVETVIESATFFTPSKGAVKKGVDNA